MSKLSTPLNRNLLVAALALSIATLSGCTTLAQLGVGPSVADPGARTTSTRLDDINLAQSVRKDIYRTIPAAGDARIEVTSFYQSILLTGEVPTADMKAKVADIAKSYGQVTAVHNELIVGPDRSVGDRFSDSVLESKAGFTLSHADGIRSEQSRVVAVDGTVYLMGKLSQRETDRAIVRLQALDGIRRIVKIVDIVPEPSSND